MRAITIRQPWAQLTVYGYKKTEFRNWTTPYRGPLAIHAGLAWDDAGATAAHNNHLNHVTSPIDCPVGAIVGTAQLLDIHSSQDCATLGGTYCSPWALNTRYHWLLANPRHLNTPIPCRGKQGLWVVPTDISNALNIINL